MNLVTTEQIKTAREKSGYTQKEMAEKLGTTWRSYWSYEQKPGSMKASMYLKLCEILKLKPF